MAATERSRGQRRTAGLMEECVLIDQTALNEIIIPTTNVDRLLPDGSRHKEEVVNKSQIYITTAGLKIFRLRVNYPNCWEAKILKSC